MQSERPIFSSVLEGTIELIVEAIDFLRSVFRSNWPKWAYRHLAKSPTTLVGKEGWIAHNIVGDDPIREMNTHC